jgi:pyruvate kinase
MAFLPATAAAGQLVATLGPASFDLAPELARAGATALRLNASHMEPSALCEAAARARAALPEVPLIVDLQGAKMRLGHFAERAVRVGDRLRFTIGGLEPSAVPLPHGEIFEQTRVHETLSMDDDRLRFRVLARDRDQLEAEALTSGRLLPRKGVNVVEHPVVLEELTPADAAVVAACAGLGHIAWAFSFMVDGREVEWVKRRSPGSQVVGKVERREAVARIEMIASRCDALWICRGDLGAQLGMRELARFVAAFDPGRLARPILMAGQVLEHLTQHAEPTRSEVCHLFDLIARGYAGIVLSDETAVGVDAVRAVRVAASLLSESAR